jgi:hypothetical protein
MRLPLEDREARDANYAENTDNFTYYIALGNEKDKLARLRDCRVVGDRIIITYSKRPQPVKPFPNPEQATFTPQFK